MSQVKKAFRYGLKIKFDRKFMKVKVEWQKINYFPFLDFYHPMHFLKTVRQQKRQNVKNSNHHGLVQKRFAKGRREVSKHELSLTFSGSLEEQSSSRKFEDENEKPVDQGLVFRTSCLTPRTPPPKSIFKKERYFYLCISDHHVHHHHVLFLAPSSQTMFLRINLMMSKSIKNQGMFQCIISKET